MAFMAIETTLKIADRADGDATVKLSIITEHVREELAKVAVLVKQTEW